MSVDELRDDTEFGDIYQDIHDECTKYGKSNYSSILRKDLVKLNILCSLKLAKYAYKHICLSCKSGKVYLYLHLTDGVTH